MALIQEIHNGEVVKNNSSKIAEKAKGADEETFLTLLVAEMQNQDPLEPSESTDWIAQYAQFTQVETINNMSDSLDMMRANSLVGKEVYIKSVNGKGETGYVKGQVDYVVYQGGKVKLSIGEKLYELADLDTVVDSKYSEAYNLAESFDAAIKKLPKKGNLTLADAEEVERLTGIYASMTDYQKGFISEDNKNTLADALLTIRDLKAIEENAAKTEDSEESESEVKEL